jgi:alcohol dehydrogenase
LSEHGITREILPRLADLAAKQWTAQFNPRKVGEAELLKIYESAF